MKQRMILLSIMMVLLVPGLAQAQRRPVWIPERAGNWDFAMQTRYTTSSDFSGDGGSKLSLDDNLGWGFGFNYHMNNNFALGLAFNWRSIGYQALVIDAKEPLTTHEYGGNLSISTAALTGDWNILDGPITPYVNGSIGWTLIDTNILAGVASGCWWDPWWGYICSPVPVTYGRSTATYTLGLGGRFEMNDSFFIRAGYEYGWISDVNVDGTNMLRIDLGLLLF